MIQKSSMHFKLTTGSTYKCKDMILNRTIHGEIMTTMSRQDHSLASVPPAPLATYLGT